MGFFLFTGFPVALTSFPGLTSSSLLRQTHITYVHIILVESLLQPQIKCIIMIVLKKTELESEWYCGWKWNKEAVTLPLLMVLIQPAYRTCLYCVHVSLKMAAIEKRKCSTAATGKLIYTNSCSHCDLVLQRCTHAPSLCALMETSTADRSWIAGLNHLDV